MIPIRPQDILSNRPWLYAFLALAGLLVVALVIRSTMVVEEAEASGPPVNVHVLLSSAQDGCFESANALAVRRMVVEEQDRLNRRGGVWGRRVQVILHDDLGKQEQLNAALGSILADPDALAIVGLSNANRAGPAIAAHMEKLKSTAIPFISDLPIDGLAAALPSLFTMRASQEDDIVPVMSRLTKSIGFKNPAFVGDTGRASLDNLRNNLGAALGGFVANIPINVTDANSLPPNLPAIVDELKAKNPDVIFLYTRKQVAGELIAQMRLAGITPAIFMSGSISSEELPQSALDYPNAMYALNWNDPPEVLNDRVRQVVTGEDPAAWMFDGRRRSAPGWSTGECKPLPDAMLLSPFASERNLRAISRGAKFADMIAFAAKTARADQPASDVPTFRARVLRGLQQDYKVGRNTFQGTFEPWSFVPESRSAAFVPLINIRPQGLGRLQLAPFQVVRSKDGSLRKMDTLYLDIDLVKAHRVDENAKTFFAEFILSMRNNAGATLDRIEFSNAALDIQGRGGRQIAIEEVHDGGASDAYPDATKIYKVSGLFLFEPQLGNYPFDTQEFSIEIQPKNYERPFIIQPPPLALRDKLVVTDGWEVTNQYVGYDRGYVPMIDAYTHQPSVVPFYHASFVWDMKRHATDYLLRVAVPLGFILLVAYFSIFIPRSHFEAIVTIQVTALLSAVALYLSLPSLDSDTATLSDLAFVMAYMVVSMMIGVSILRISPVLERRAPLDRALFYTHIAGIPLFLVIAAFVVLRYAYG